MPPTHLRLILTISFSLLLPPLCSPVTVSVTPKTIAKSGDPVRIHWSGVESPSNLDWLGIYSPPDSHHKNFIGYVFLNSSKDWRSGSGSVDLPLVNIRSNYVFRLFRWNPDEVDFKHLDHDRNPLPGTRHLLAQSDEVGFVGLKGPDQIHLSFTDTEDEMRVLFVTGDGSQNYVNYGLEEGRLNEMVGTEVKRYESGDMCDAPANTSIGWRDPGFIHDGVMRNLKKGTRYYYRVGSDAGGWSATHSFMSRDNNSNETIAFLFGDMGTFVPYSTFIRTQEESISTVKWILRDIKTLGDKPAFVSHIGDISYARGYSWVWDHFFNQVEPIASMVPYHVCIGNHEYDWPLQPWKPSWSYGVYGKDGGGECGVPYSLKFHMPGNSSLTTGTRSPNTRNLYYSFDVGVVHFLYFSTETDFLRGSDQYNFIKHDLESVDRGKTPFVVIQGHRPMYTTSNELRDAPIRERMLEHLEPLLVENNVTLALWGHVHRYERFCPIKNFSCLDTASEFYPLGSPVHVVIGMAGNDWQPIWEPRDIHPEFPIYPQPERSMYRGGEFGYTRLYATRDKLTLTYVGNHDGEVHDVIEIPSGLILKDGGGEAVAESKFLTYAGGAGFLVLGTLLGYAVGFVSRSRRESVPKTTWTPVKSEDV